MNIRELTKLFDVEYFDGPLLSLFADDEGNFFLYKWYDLTSHAHQWLVFKVHYLTLLKYLHGMSNEFGLLNDELNKSFYLVEFSEKGIPKVVGIKPQADVLEEYYALKEVFFDSDLCPNWKAVQHFFQLKRMDVESLQLA